MSGSAATVPPAVTDDVSLTGVHAAGTPGEVAAGASRPPEGQRRVGRETLIYGLGMIVSRLASFIMLPLYTRLLTPADYGLLQMLDMTVDVVSILFSVGCTLGVMRFYFKATEESQRRRVLSSAFALQMALNFVGSLCLVAFAEPIWRQGLNGAGRMEFVWIAAANFTMGALIAVPLLRLQMQGRALRYSLINLAKLVLNLSLNILFLVGFRWGPVGILLSGLITHTVVGGFAAVTMLRETGLRVDRPIVRNLWAFGFPYQIAGAGSFILTFGDRFVLQPAWGLAAVGLYGFAYQFGFLLDQVGRAPYMRAWTPRRFEIASHPREVRDAEYNTGFLYLSLALLTTAVGIAVLIHPVLRVMSDRAFYPAADLVPLILFAYVLQAWAEAVQFGIDVSEQTRYSGYATWISVVVIVALYLVLIPPLGGLGAALATVISFAVRFACFYRFAQRLWPISYHWAPHARLFAYAAVMAIVARIARPDSLLLELVLGGALIGIYALAVWYTVLQDAQRRAVAGLVRARLRVVSARFARA